MVKRTQEDNKLILDNHSIESFNHLRTNILYTGNIKVIAVTSSVPDEGKTVIAFNLAKSLSQIGKKVVLVDGDLRKSTLKKYLRVHNSYTGISEYLTLQSKDYIQETHIENMSVVFAGKKTPNPSELLSSHQFELLIEELKGQFDYVIIDTPPLAVATDAVIISRIASGVILVARNEFTKKRVLNRSKMTLERNGVRIIGLVLNRVIKNRMNYGYSQYY